MKANVQTLNVPQAVPLAPAAEKSMAVVLSELFKTRLTTLVLLTTLVGFYLGSRGPISYGLMFSSLIGTALLASGASALNQLLERDYDAKMRRTRNRPLPSGRLTPEAVLIIGSVCAGAGLIWLALGVNLVTALLGAATLGSYVFIYTPLKRVTTLNTAIGAIPGALPPLMGWAAARGEISAEGWSLFAIICFWQLPHFLAIAWMYRDEYARAGFVMLPVSLAPFLYKLVGPVYLAGALLLGAAFIGFAFQFARERSMARARALFYASILYLPILFGLMVVDKIKAG